ncbi:MAG: protease complex subunit PrcB family protein [Deinococcota bacterium]
MRYPTCCSVYALALVLLVSCVPREDAALNLHDIALYSAEESVLLAYFFGTPRRLNLGGDDSGIIELTEGTIDDPFSVRGALLVDGEPNVRESLDAVASPVSVSRIPFSSDVVLASTGNTGAVVYYDGNFWFDLAGATSPGINQRIIPRQRLQGLRNLAELTNEEATMLERALAEQAPYVLAELPPQDERLRDTSGISDYRRSEFFLQTSLPTTEEILRTPVTEPGWRIFAEGDIAAIASSDFAIATSDNELIELWNIAYGNQLAQPPLPEVDFARQSIIGIFVGERPTGGYSLQARSVVIEGNDVYIGLQENSPPEGAITTQVLTSPWLMVQVNRPALDVAWIRDAQTNDLIAVARRQF